MNIDEAKSILDRARHEDMESGDLAHIGKVPNHHNRWRHALTTMERITSGHTGACNRIEQIKAAREVLLKARLETRQVKAQADDYKGEQPLTETEIAGEEAK
jgi:hypothetical protein